MIEEGAAAGDVTAVPGEAASGSLMWIGAVAAISAILLIAAAAMAAGTAGIENEIGGHAERLAYAASVQEDIDVYRALLSELPSYETIREDIVALVDSAARREGASIASVLFLEDKKSSPVEHLTTIHLEARGSGSALSRLLVSLSSTSPWLSVVSAEIGAGPEGGLPELSLVLEAVSVAGVR